MDDSDKSLSDEATFAGASKRRPAAEMSLGDERTLGDRLGDQDTAIEDIEVVDLEARYKVEGTLGQGGMGAVLLATDTRLGRKVAVKRILGEAARSKTAIMRFLTEAKAIAALNHQNIVQIYDYGRAKDGPFLIMEYVDGGSLLDRCREGALPLEDAVDLACQLCDGLAKAHDAGIVHRDIKPANVLLNRDGLPKLTDFGLAKADAADHGMTMTGAVMGTPDFMPPEQRRDASEVDARSDLWSLAATVYQMVTGRSPKIIRFNDIPAALQDVLGKALEDRKDSRYQTVRELRDALKTSLRAAAVAMPDVLEGKCPACGVQNDSSRRFCRGCGESLESPCLSCAKPMPMWEEICGSCGAKQAPIVDERRRAMAAKQAEAEGLLGDFEFDRALGIATRLRDEAHPKLKHLAGWGASFLERIEKSRTEQTRHAVEAMTEAGKHVAEYDYLSAGYALEMVPAALRAGILPGMRESAGAMLDRVKKMQGEARRLEARIEERLAAKQLDELLPDVERLLTLRPDRDDLQKIRMQLLERQQKQAAARDQAIELANANIASHDYEQALAALSVVAPALITPEVVTLREQAEDLIRKVKALAAKIKEAVAAKQFDGLLGTVEQYLELKPSDAEIGKLRQSLAEREEKYAVDIAARLQQAEQLEQACRFDEAEKLLTAIPKPRRTQRVVGCLGRASRLGPMRHAALAALTTAKSGGYEAAIESSQPYESAIAGLTDTEFSTLLAQVRSALADEESTRRALRRAGIAAAVLVLLTTVTLAGLWARSTYRGWVVNQAVAQGQWDNALAIEPDNVAALVGRARKKLQATPIDVDGAFADLDRATASGHDSVAIKSARADAHAVRAGDLVKSGSLDKAAQDLVIAERSGARAAIVAAAKAALAAEWLARAEEASEKGDIARLKQAVASAITTGATKERIQSLQARTLVLEATASLRSDGATSGARKAIEALLIDAEGTVATLRQPMNKALREAVLEEYRARMDAAVAANDWDTGLRVAAAAGAIEDATSGWISEAIAKHPGGVKSLSPAAALSPAVIMALPPLRNSLGIELKILPAGTFTMGEGSGTHQVTLTKPFYIGVYEVTNAQWKQVMGSVPSNWKNDDLPVENVNWADAIEFCKKLSELPEERKAGRVYRLPTEAEWEYACRAGSTTQYSFGDDESQMGDYGWFAGNSETETHAVGKKKPNPWGLFDMHGNVWEWCGDWYGAYPKTAVTDPQGPSGASGRVHRSGSWVSTAGACRSANRDWNPLSFRDSRLGFRLALSPSGAEPLKAAVSTGRKPGGLTAEPATAMAEAVGGVIKPRVEPAPPDLPGTVRNTVGSELKLLSAGTFTMGEGSEAHQVTLTKPFYIGVYEVTNAQWKQVMGSVPSNWKNDDLPVENVNWADATEFCKKLSELPEERNAGRVYRLPTEAEWEYACRAGSTTQYSFGDDESQLGEYGWFDGNSGRETHAVGKKKPNAWGLFDMHGNVWEWCSDWYAEYPKGAVTDPQGPSGASARVNRGGCWNNAARICRSAIRGGGDPSYRFISLGFRLAMSPSGVQKARPEAIK